MFMLSFIFVVVYLIIIKILTDKIRFDIVFLITGNADTIYNIRNRNEMTDRNRKLSRNTAKLPNRKEIDNRKGVR